jgi:hypothetical protein
MSYISRIQNASTVSEVGKRYEFGYPRPDIIHHNKHERDGQKLTIDNEKAKGYDEKVEMDKGIWSSRDTAQFIDDHLDDTPKGY